VTVHGHLVRYSEEVEQALSDGRPIVALETTIITHGMPHPHNVQTALSVERIIRDAGAVPATICVDDGHFQVGMTVSQIEALAANPNVVKASRRDLSVLLGKRMTASTTVAATMIAAKMAGIAVFVTGGIGGVHRGAAMTMDVSADLQELGRTDVVVVCAGAKAILDIGLTLEVLETLGVPVLGYQTDRFPAFYTRDSGYAASDRVDTPQQVAEIARIQREMGLGAGILVGNPIPADAELDALGIDASIGQALQEAAAGGVTGKAVTPFLLSALERLTHGESLRANVRLIEHNAKVGAEIAVAMTSGA